MSIFDEIHDEIAIKRAENERLYQKRKAEGFEILLKACEVADLMMSKRKRRTKKEMANERSTITCST